jgi:adenylosuccinate synthase
MNSKEFDDFIQFIEKESNIPVSIISFGPNRDDISHREKKNLN